jgi:small ligand-binding sensory domain FIST
MEVIIKMRKIVLLGCLALCGCATQSDFEQLRALTLTIAKAHNALVGRVQKLEATPTPVPAVKK